MFIALFSKQRGEGETMKRLFTLQLIVVAGLLTMKAYPSEVSVSPRTGELALVQKDHELPTPLGRMPIARSYDRNEKSGIFGPGWRLDVLSEIRFLDESG